MCLLLRRQAENFRKSPVSEQSEMICRMKLDAKLRCASPAAQALDSGEICEIRVEARELRISLRSTGVPAVTLHLA